MSQIDNSTSNAHTLQELNITTKNSNKKDKSKSKKTDDNVVESGVGQTTMQADDGQIPNKKRRRTNKEKNNRDDITEGTIGDGKKKRSRKVDDENDGDPTTQNKTDYGTNPTNKDFL